MNRIHPGPRSLVSFAQQAERARGAAEVPHCWVGGVLARVSGVSWLCVRGSRVAPSLAMEFTDSTDGAKPWYQQPPPAPHSPGSKIAAAHNAQMGEWVLGCWLVGFESGCVCFVICNIRFDLFRSPVKTSYTRELWFMSLVMV